MAGFNNLTQMRSELIAAGYQAARNWDEARLIHEYDVVFLANNYEHREESKQYFPKGVRISTGPYKGRFPNGA